MLSIPFAQTSLRSPSANVPSMFAPRCQHLMIPEQQKHTPDVVINVVMNVDSACQCVQVSCI